MVLFVCIYQRKNQTHSKSRISTQKQNTLTKLRVPKVACCAAIDSKLNLLSFLLLLEILFLQCNYSFCKAIAKIGLQEAVLRGCNRTWTHNHLVRKRTLEWPNGWVFVYELSGCRFESHCSHLSLRYRACFEQGVP